MPESLMEAIQQTSPASSNQFLDDLKIRLTPLYARLAEHRLYRSFHTLDDVRLFMESHVYAVWDFMSLLKALQRGLTCVEVPWLPTKDASTRRLVNEIVLGEESDIYQGRAISHFDLYLEAMEACGASTRGVRKALAALSQGEPVPYALASASAPREAQDFVSATFQIIGSGKLHAIAAAFTFGREDLIPDIFRGFVRELDQQSQGQLTLFRWYLERHIEVDGDEHGPMALQMVANLCGDDPELWYEASIAAVQAVKARLTFWDTIASRLAL